MSSPPFMQLQRRTLRSLGFSLRADESPLWRAAVAVQTASLALIVAPELWFVWCHLDDLPLATNALCTVMYCFMSLPKLLTMQVHRQRWYRLLGELSAAWEASEGEDRRTLAAFGRIDSTMSWVYSVSCYVAAALYLSYPLARSYYELWTSGTAEWTMPMRSIFPYDVQRSPHFQLTYLWFVQATFAAVFGSLATDTFYYGCAMALSGQLRCVQRRFGALAFGTGAGAETKQRRRGSGRSAVGELGALLRLHDRVLGQCADLVRVCVPFVFTQFLIASMQLCVVAYQLTLPFESYVTIAIFAVFLWSICYECFVYCHAGTKLLTESSAVADAIYASRWYRALDAETRGCVAFAMARSQRGVAVRGVFFDATLVTFSSIMSTTGSYITLLQALPGE